MSGVTEFPTSPDSGGEGALMLPWGAFHSRSESPVREDRSFLCFRETDCASLQNYRQPHLPPAFHTSFVKRTVITLEETLGGKSTN